MRLLEPRLPVLAPDAQLTVEPALLLRGGARRGRRRRSWAGGGGWVRGLKGGGGGQQGASRAPGSRQQAGSGARWVCISGTYLLSLPRGSALAPPACLATRQAGTPRCRCRRRRQPRRPLGAGARAQGLFARACLGRAGAVRQSPWLRLGRGQRGGGSRARQRWRLRRTPRGGQPLAAGRAACSEFPSSSDHHQLPRCVCPSRLLILQTAGGVIATSAACLLVRTVLVIHQLAREMCAQAAYSTGGVPDIMHCQCCVLAGGHVQART